MSLKERIRAARDTRGEPLDVPEWGETVYVRRLSAAEAIAYRDWATDLEKAEADELRRGVALVLRTVTLCVVDEQGEQVFGPEDEGWLAAKNQDALRRIFERAGQLAGMTAEAREAIRKNSGEAGGASPSASPSPTTAPTSMPSSTN